MTTMQHKRHYYLYYRFNSLEGIIFGKMFQYQNEGYPEILCRTTLMQDYINIFRELEIWSQDKSIQKDSGDREHAKLFKSIALDNDEHKVSTYILVAIDKHCQNYDVKDLLQYKRKEK